GRAKKGGLSLSGLFFVDKLRNLIATFKPSSAPYSNKDKKHAGEVRPWLTLARCKLPTMMRWPRGTRSWPSNCWCYGAMRWRREPLSVLYQRADTTHQRPAGVSSSQPGHRTTGKVSSASLPIGDPPKSKAAQANSRFVAFSGNYRCANATRCENRFLPTEKGPSAT